MRVSLRFALVAGLGLVACGKADPSQARADEGAPVASAASASVSVATPSASVAPVASAAPAKAEGPAPGELNVILITVDSMRADMPWAGYERPIAPTLTALEKRAVSYTHAYALSSYTSMSLGGMLAGRYPGEVKRDGYFFGTYPPDVTLFPEKLRAAGVRTMGVQAHGYFKKGGAGFEQGFDAWRVVPGIKWNAQTDENVTGPQMEKISEELLGDPANTSGKFFFWAHFLDPHDGYMPHADVEPWGKKARDLYDGEITFTDRQIGKLLDFVAAQPWAKKTAIVVSADHGESFGEHGVYRHGFEVFQNLVRVPWFFVLPGVEGRRIAPNRSHLDMAPTILELLGVAAEPSFEGQSLVAELYGKVEPDARDVIVDLPRTSDNDRRRALVRGDTKVIAFGDDAYFQVYDVGADPDETRSLEKTDRPRFDEMVGLYRAATKKLKDVGPYACRKLKGAPEGRDY